MSVLRDELSALLEAEARLRELGPSRAVTCAGGAALERVLKVALQSILEQANELQSFERKTTYLFDSAVAVLTERAETATAMVLRDIEGVRSKADRLELSLADRSSQHASNYNTFERRLHLMEERFKRDLDVLASRVDNVEAATQMQAVSPKAPGSVPSGVQETLARVTGEVDALQKQFTRVESNNTVLNELIRRASADERIERLEEALREERRWRAGCFPVR
eukprot:Sspe_Gene.80683::Locus_51059_Transcript_1_1_Confidence_1.000_Length_1067::g.80683::m.80683